MVARKRLWEVLHPMFLSWKSSAHISVLKRPLRPAVRYYLERQKRAVIKSIGFSVKANVDSNPSPVAYWLCDLGNYLTPELYLTLLYNEN